MVSQQIQEIKEFLVASGFSDSFHSAVILGSGLGGFTKKIAPHQSIPYERIPHFSPPSVEGHSGQLYSGRVNNKPILAFSGRFHRYEGHSFNKTVRPIQLAHAFNVNNLIISNAAGSINTGFHVGDLMVIDDIIRPFHSVSSTPSTSFHYNLYSVAEKVRKIASEIGLDVQRGSYLFVNGPNYETPAEIEAFRILGADVVGMSTAPELIEASRLNIKTAAISLVTNMASGVTKEKLHHDEVKKAAESRKEDFARLVEELIVKL